MTASQALGEGMDLAQQITTALVYRDRELAGDLVEQVYDDTSRLLGLALALADLTVHVHWSEAVGADPVEGWQALLTDIEDLRTTREPDS